MKRKLEEKREKKRRNKREETKRGGAFGTEMVKRRSDGRRRSWHTWGDITKKELRKTTKSKMRKPMTMTSHLILHSTTTTTTISLIRNPRTTKGKTIVASKRELFLRQIPEREE